MAKTILERYQITDKVELIFKEDYLILKPAHHPREGWEVDNIVAIFHCGNRRTDELMN